jgi:hypothetical protein
MLPLLESEKLLLPLLGACQKSPQPARKQAISGVAASINRDHLPIFIAAPLVSPSDYHRQQALLLIL